MITLRIFLMGLIALVPREDDRALTVLLQDAQAECEQHIPVLIYERGSRVCEGAGCEFGDAKIIAEKLSLTSKAPGILLGGYEISVDGAEDFGIDLSSTTGSRGIFRRLGGVVPKKRRDIHDLSWLSRMSEIEPNSSTVKKELLEIDPPGLAGRMTVLDGQLRIASFADFRGAIRSMTFRPFGSSGRLFGIKQAVVDVAAISLGVHSNNKGTVVIRLTPLQDSKDLQPVVLELKPHGNKVDILLGNLTPLKDGIDPGEAAKHFALYTKLTDNYKGPDQMSIPHVGASIMGFQSIDNRDVDDEMPPVIKSVSGDYSKVITAVDREGEGGTNRPICTLAVMSAPEGVTSVRTEAEEVQQGRISNDLAPLRNIYERILEVAADDDYISGIDISDCVDDEIAVRVQLEDPARQEEVIQALEDMFGKSAPIKVVVARYIAEQGAGRRGKVDPLKPGVSISLDDPHSREGTLGLIVRKNAKDFLLSAAHVLPRVGSVVLQPCRNCSNSPKKVGKVALVDDEFDAALVEVKNGQDVNLAQYRTEAKIEGVRFAEIGDYVIKSSVATDVRKGRVCSVGVYRINYSDGKRRLIQGFGIVPQYNEEEISAPSDSGGLWYSQGGTPLGLGLHVAGEDGADPEFAIASDLCLVLNALGVPLNEQGWSSVTCPEGKRKVIQERKD